MGFCRRPVILILSSLVLLLYEMTDSSAQDMAPIAVTIPRELESVSIRAVVETTECSVTCGLGSKVEKRCLVDRSGIQQDCEVVRVDCLTNWVCGMQVFTMKVGDRFSMDCHLPSSATRGGTKLYHWKVALGMVSNNDNRFRPLNNKNSTIVFESIQEKNAGTYRCDVQTEDDLKFVKRVYFAVRIFTPGIIDIDFDKYVINKQKLAVMAEGLTTQHVDNKVEADGGISITYAGIASSAGLFTAIVVLVLVWSKHTAKKEVLEE
ncbi:transmembrane protein 81 [Dendropsophus ebraccatus]|uniref:transmembrane protein 81 n=1 Tax=Dendropsophus ebraccatus TaxID=150705 RepID=UPI003831BA72